MVRGSTTQITGVSDSDLAVLLRQTQWALDEAAYDFPAGRATAQRRKELAGSLEALAAIVRAWAPAEIRHACAESVSLRCGRSVPALHLVEADETLTRPCWRVGGCDHVALCGAELDESTPVPDFDGECPGCVDCSRYCFKCVRTAAGRIGS